MISQYHSYFHFLVCLLPIPPCLAEMDEETRNIIDYISYIGLALGIVILILACILMAMEHIAERKKRNWRKLMIEDYDTYTSGKVERMQRATDRWDKINDWVQQALCTFQAVHILRMKEVFEETAAKIELRQFLCQDFIDFHPKSKFTFENATLVPHCTLIKDKHYNRAFLENLLSVDSGKKPFYVSVNQLISVKKPKDLADEFKPFAIGQIPSEKELANIVDLWTDNLIKVCVTVGPWHDPKGDVIQQSKEPRWEKYDILKEQMKVEDGIEVCLLKHKVKTSFQVMHLWLPDWPEPTKGPQRFDQLANLMHKVYKAMHQIEKPFCVLVQCQDGVNRSGIFTGLLMAERMIELTEIVNLPAVIYQLRVKRSPFCFKYMVQREVLFQAVFDYQLRYAKLAPDITNSTSMSLPLLENQQKKNKAEAEDEVDEDDDDEMTSHSMSEHDSKSKSMTSSKEHKSNENSALSHTVKTEMTEPIDAKVVESKGKGIRDSKEGTVTKVMIKTGDNNEEKTTADPITAKDQSSLQTSRMFDSMNIL